MSIIIIVIAWRLAIGMMDKIRYGETTFILQFPVWWPFAACMVAAVIAIVVSLYMTGVRFMELVTGRSADLQHQGSVH